MIVRADFNSNGLIIPVSITFDADGNYETKKIIGGVERTAGLQGDSVIQIFRCNIGGLGKNRRDVTLTFDGTHWNFIEGFDKERAMCKHKELVNFLESQIKDTLLTNINELWINNLKEGNESI